MDFRECRWCHRPFQYANSVYCPACDKRFDDVFLAVRDYLDENPAATIHEVTESLGVEQDIILRLLKDERLSFASGTPLRCERCGTGISSGQFCKDCRGSMQEDISSLLSDYKKESGASQKQYMSAPGFHSDRLK